MPSSRFDGKRWKMPLASDGEPLGRLSLNSPYGVDVMPVSEHEELMNESVSIADYTQTVAEWSQRCADEVRKGSMVRDELQTLRVLVHGHTQVIRGMCSDELDHREIDRALVRLDDAVNPPEDP